MWLHTQCFKHLVIFIGMFETFLLKLEYKHSHLILIFSEMGDLTMSFGYCILLYQEEQKIFVNKAKTPPSLIIPLIRNILGCFIIFMILIPWNQVEELRPIFDFFTFFI